MCGIVGVFASNTQNNIQKKPGYQATDSTALTKLFKELLLESQSRGKDSSGLVTSDAQGFHIYKEPVDIKQFVNTTKYRELTQKQESQTAYFAMGHSRMETHGSFLEQENNQPVVKGQTIAFHNGIIVDTDQIWPKLTNQKRDFEVDSEIFCSLFNESLQKSPEDGLFTALKQCFSDLEGSFSLALVFSDFDICILTTNTGSLYVAKPVQNSNFLFFASEKTFIQNAAAKASLEELHIKQLLARSVVIFRPSTLEVLFDGTIDTLTPFKIPQKAPTTFHQYPAEKTASRPRSQNTKQIDTIHKLVQDGHNKATAHSLHLRRCTRCILPSTMPFIFFDSQGVCNYCHRYQKRSVSGKDALLKAIEPYRRPGKDPECIVSFSGGRDSSYALHYVKKELGLRPLAYSYDWGMLTDLGRRNQARMTGALGVEHILIAADIQKKRENIRKNVEAWLKAPHLGIVPLFMAGDKQYFYHLNRLQKRTGLDLMVYADNSFEKSDFKYGFAGVANRAVENKAYHVGTMNSLRLLAFYGSKFLSNPRYWNSSVLDTLTAYWSSYFEPKNYLQMFKYILWDESTLEKTLFGEYNWELAPDTQSSWRIGDGTASFYNYIYYVGAGFTEHDTFRSNQIREGIINRKEALELAKTGNEPREESIIWYCDTIGINATYALQQVNRLIPRQLAIAASTSEQKTNTESEAQP